jgi:RNA polymerase sigma factor (sigma-70 family)
VVSLETDAQLLARAPDDPDAFGRFYERHERLIAGYLMRRSGDPEVAADLTAEVFAAALEAAPRFRESGESAAPWLLAIAHNALASSVRRGRVEEEARRRLGVMTAVELRSSSLHRIERLVESDAWVTELLAGLPTDQRDAVRARVLEDRDYEHIASELQTSSLVIRKRVSRGLAHLRRQLEGER